MHIKEFQTMMHQIYFKRDSKRGINGTIDWLRDEVEELREALQKGDINSAEKEFADVLAWLASLANIVKIDLEKASLTKYKNMCPKCGQSPCNCQF
ncbi:nucleotide pyrophosphohydrolase [Candidatus Bathyarchaeota archaeon]|nr:nucleotide pyrophosphohydrolase [Candidatus Bathyarchaeota archaeon]